MSTDVAVAEIQRLLKEAYDDYFNRGDGHCKSSEGCVTIHYPPYWDFGKPPRIEVYSYVFCPSGRYMNFPSPEAALAEVRAWRDDQLNSPPSDDWFGDLDRDDDLVVIGL